MWLAVTLGRATASSARRALPRSPHPSDKYLRRQRSSSARTRSDADLLAHYEAMRSQLAKLSAMGVLEEHGKEWTAESSMAHLQMVGRHMWRFALLFAASVVRGLRRGCFAGRAEEPLPTRLPQGKAARAEEDTGDDDDMFETAPDPDGFETNPSLASLARRGLVMPLSAWKEKWDLLILFFILYSAVVVPLRVCFEAPATGIVWFVEVGITLTFIVDVYFNFITIYFDTSNGKWVTAKGKLARRYLSGWFWIDAPSSVPVEIISLFFDAQKLSILRILRMVRLVRLAKLFKLEEYIETLESRLDMNLRLLRIVMVVIKMLFLGHILGCFWYGMSLFADSEAQLEASGGTWRATYEDGRVISPNATTALRYAISVYWAVTTMTTTGYGDLTPVNDFETVYALLAMLSSSLIFGYMISNVGVLVASMDRKAEIIEEKLDSAKEYVAFRGLPKALAVRVKKHFSYFYAGHAGFDEVELLSGLSPSLRSEVTRYVLKETLGRIPLFVQTLDPEFQLEVFPYITPVSYSAGDVIFRKGETSRDLMFLLVGDISILSAKEPDVVTTLLTSFPSPREIILARDRTPLLTMENAGCFGESVLLGLRRPATHVATKWCETLALAKEHLSQLFTSNPRAGVQIVQTLLAETGRRQRLNSLMARFVISMLPKDSETRAAMIIQRVWQRTMMRLCAASAPITRILEPELTSDQRSRLRVLDHARDKTLGVIHEMRTQLRAGTLDVSADAPAWRPALQRPESTLVDSLLSSAG
jgi:CRP-like cAMP-binding protein